MYVHIYIYNTLLRDTSKGFRLDPLIFVSRVIHTCLKYIYMYIYIYNFLAYKLFTLFFLEYVRTQDVAYTQLYGCTCTELTFVIAVVGLNTHTFCHPYVHLRMILPINVQTNTYKFMHRNMHGNFRIRVNLLVSVLLCRSVIKYNCKT